MNISLAEIWTNKSEHSTNTQWYRDTKEKLRIEIEEATNSKRTQVNFENIGLITLPIYSMGQITSTDLFGLDELILFSIYQKRKERGIAIDLGANIGLHSIVLSKLGYEVLAVEPDPEHVKQIKTNLLVNEVQSVKILEKAVSYKTGFAEFIRVEGNTTGSHLAGSQGKNPYGALRKFQVETVAISELLTLHPATSLVKMDVEGYEAELICSLESNFFNSIDFLLEVGSYESADLIYAYLKRQDFYSISQKTGWEKVFRLEDMHSSYKDGSLISPKQS
jgi:FkbM family methyltransferase